MSTDTDLSSTILCCVLKSERERSVEICVHVMRGGQNDNDVTHKITQYNKSFIKTHNH